MCFRDSTRDFCGNYTRAHIRIQPTILVLRVFCWNKPQSDLGWIGWVIDEIPSYCHLISWMVDVLITNLHVVNYFKKMGKDKDTLVNSLINLPRTLHIYAHIVEVWVKICYSNSVYEVSLRVEAQSLTESTLDLVLIIACGFNRTVWDLERDAWVNATESTFGWEFV